MLTLRDFFAEQRQLFFITESLRKRFPLPKDGQSLLKLSFGKKSPRFAKDAAQLGRWRASGFSHEVSPFASSGGDGQQEHERMLPPAPYCLTGEAEPL